MEFSEQKLGMAKYIQGRDEFSRWRMNLRLLEVPFVGPKINLV